MERVLGTPALFATAYGNVGSSIYYALGLTAVYALGLTPLVFVVAGVDLRRDGGDLRRGHRPLPGGRRLGQLRPACLRRGRELHGRVGADARVRRDRRGVGVLRAALPLDLLGAAELEPVGHRRRRDRDRRARLAERGRRAGGGEALDLARGGRLRDADPARHRRLRARLQPAGRSSTTSTGASRRRGRTSRSRFRSRCSRTRVSRPSRTSPRRRATRSGPCRTRTGSSRVRSSRSTSRFRSSRSPRFP